LSMGITAIQQTFTWQMTDDLTIRSELNHIAHGICTFFSLGKTLDQSAIGQFDFVVPTKSGDNGALFAQSK